MSAQVQPSKRDYRPPRALVLTTPEHLIAFGFGAGLAPFAPGTFGTVMGVPFWLLLFWLPLKFYLGAVLLLFVLGCWACGRSAKLLGVHDYGGIVFDEVVGFLLTCVPLLPTFHLFESHAWAWLAAAFVLFRFFDILKPPPIGWLDEHVHGGFGIMLDDVVAGAYAAAVLWFSLWIATLW